MNSHFLCLIISFTIAVMISTAPDLYSFDGKRKGFILGGGIGIGFFSNSFPETVTDLGLTLPGETMHAEEFAFLLDLKIGYAPSNLTAFYFSIRSSQWSETELQYWFGDDVFNAVLLFTGFGGTRYFKETEQSLFLSGGVGYTSLGATDSDDYIQPNGVGVFLGGGYEYSSHWSIEAEVFVSRLSAGEINFNSVGVRLSFNYLAY